MWAHVSAFGFVSDAFRVIYVKQLSRTMPGRFFFYVFFLKAYSFRSYIKDFGPFWIDFVLLLLDASLDIITYLQTYTIMHSLEIYIYLQVWSFRLLLFPGLRSLVILYFLRLIRLLEQMPLSGYLKKTMTWVFKVIEARNCLLRTCLLV